MASSAVKYEIVIKQDVVNVYRDNSTSSSIVGVVNKNQNIIVTEKSADGLYYYAPNYEGWIRSSNFSIVNANATGIPENRVLMKAKDADISDYIVPFDGSGSAVGLAQMTADSTAGIYGIPYQFMANVDRRVKEVNENGVGDGVGRKFAEKILSRNNLLYLQPGKQQFMKGMSKADQSSILANLTSLATNGSAEDVMTANGRYYSFALDYGHYFDYVNSAARAVASLMGLSNQQVSINGQTGSLRTFDWSNALNGSYAKDLFGIENNITFYMDGMNQISEDFGNSTRESSLVATVNGYSDTVKEINYVMDTMDNPMAIAVDEGFEQTASQIQQTIDGFTSGTGVLNALLGNTTTILNGGKLVFPEMWSDSDYDRTYNIDIKLRSPEADELSIYLNIIVPYIHLVALTAPRDFDIDGNGNGYKAPFLVRAFVRSMFNIDLGIITSLSVTKGGEANWAAATNLPTSVDISLSIKDLYKSLYISNGESISRLVANDAEMEQLMTVAGVNYRELNAYDKAALAAKLIEGNVYGIPARFKSRITDELSNALGPLYIGRFR